MSVWHNIETEASVVGYVATDEMHSLKFNSLFFNCRQDHRQQTISFDK